MSTRMLEQIPPEFIEDQDWDRFATQHELTPRETRILRMACRGAGNRRIAAELEITVPTVRTHLRSVYSKIGCFDRMEALLMILQQSRQKRSAPSSD